MEKATLFKKLTSRRVQCLACNHYCRIQEGEMGICGVRKNIKGQLFLLVFNKPVTINIDPIEKKPLFHFLPGSQSFSLGTYGCNFRCPFCQNWDISQFSKGYPDFETLIAKTCKKWTAQKIVDYCRQKQISSIAYTYNEPTIFIEYCYQIMKLAHRYGIKNVFVSNGYESKEAIDYIAPYLDGINIDLKSLREEFYQKFCGSRLAPVLKTIKLIKERQIWQELTTLLIPGENDTAEEIQAIADFIATIDKNIPWHISRFYPAYQMANKEPTNLSILERAHQIGRKSGLHYVYLGNILLEKYESTFCPKCNEKLIQRKGYLTKVLSVFQKGLCLKCRTKIAGLWQV